MEIQRESTPMSEDHGMEPITRLINGIMERIQDSPGSASVRLSDSVDEKVGGAESTISIMSEELNVASSQLTNLVLDEIKATNVPLSQNVNEKFGGADSTTSILSEELNVASSQLTNLVLDMIKATNMPLSVNVDEKIGGADSTTSITSKDLKVASSQLTNLVLDEIKATNMPLSINVDEKVWGADSTTSITSKDLKVASSQLTNLVLDEIRTTFGQKEKNEKSTLTDQMPDLDPNCKKFLIQPRVTIRIPISFKVTVKKQPAEAPAKEAICPAEKMKKKKDQILGFFRRSWMTMKRIFPKRRNKVFPL